MNIMEVNKTVGNIVGKITLSIFCNIKDTYLMRTLQDNILTLSDEP